MTLFISLLICGSATITRWVSQEGRDPGHHTGTLHAGQRACSGPRAPSRMPAAFVVGSAGLEGLGTTHGRPSL